MLAFVDTKISVGVCVSVSVSVSISVSVSVTKMVKCVNQCRRYVWC